MHTIVLSLKLNGNRFYEYNAKDKHSQIITFVSRKLYYYRVMKTYNNDCKRKTDVFKH